MARIGIQWQRIVWCNRPVRRSWAQIKLPIEGVQFNLNAGIDLPRLAGHLPLGLPTFICTLSLINLLHDRQVPFTSVIC